MNNLKKSNFIVLLLSLAIFVFVSTFPVYAQEKTMDVEDISLDDLLNTKVSVASKKEEDPNDAPGIISVITKSELEGFAALNLGEILNRVTGTAFLTANYWRDNVVHFRGQSLTPYNNHTLILLNGRPLRDPISGGLNGGIYNTFPVSSLERIEIIRGPGSVLYGSCAFSGVINLVTKVAKKSTSKTDITARAGSFSTYQGVLTNVTKSDNMNLTASLNFLKSNGPEFTFTDNVGVRRTDNFDNQNLAALLDVNLKGIKINGFYGAYDTYAIGGSNLTWTEEPNSTGNHKIYFADVGYSFSLKDKGSVNIDLTLNRHEVDAEAGDTFKAQDVLFEAFLKYALSNTVNIVSGATYEMEKYFGTLLIERDSTSASFYTQIDATFGIAKLIGGIQYNKIKGIDGNISPRAGVIVKFDKGLGLKVLYSQAFRKGYPLETSFNHPVFKGNLELKPELINTFETQLFFSNKKINGSVTYYNSKMTQIVGRRWHVDSTNQPFGGYLKYYNREEELKFWGIETEAKLSLSRDLMLIGNFTYQESEDSNGVKNTTLHPNTIFKFGVLYNIKNISMGVFNSYFGEPYQVKGDGVKVVNNKPTSYDLLSAKVSYNLSSFLGKSKTKIKIFIEGTNLLGEDVRYPEYTSRQMNSLQPLRVGVSVLGGVTLTF